MYIENNGIFEVKTPDFEVNTNSQVSSPSKDVKQQPKTVSENGYEEVCPEGFDDSIGDLDKNIYTNALCSAAAQDCPTINDVLSFVQNNMDSITAELNKCEANLQIAEEEPGLPATPTVPDSIDLNSLIDIILTKPPVTGPLEPADEGEPGSQDKYNINEQIEASEQGLIGDCWLLAGLNSLSYSSKGQEIINDAITNNGDGTYNVSFNGVELYCTITSDQLDQARASGYYSTGDDDVLLMELGVETFLYNLQKGNVTLPDGAPPFLYQEEGNPLNGGFPRDIVYLLTGEIMQYETIITPEAKYLEGEALESFYDNQLESFYTNFEQNPDSSTGCLHIAGKKEENDVYVKDINGDMVKLTNAGENHSWSVKSVDENTVTMVNPWDSSSEFTISKDVLEQYVLGFDYLSL